MKFTHDLVDADKVMRRQFTTYTYETDPHYNARLSFYFRIIQDIAAVHAACRNVSLPELQAQGKTWMILRSHVSVKRYTSWPEDILVETWAEPAMRLHMPRAVRGYDERHAVLFEAMTHWAVLDVSHNFWPVRPQSIMDMLQVVDASDSAHFIEPQLEKIVPYDNSGSIGFAQFKPVVRMFDTDGNRHVNNISYLDWILDSLPLVFRDEYKICDIDISWLRQTFLGEQVTVHTGSPEEGAFTAEEPLLYHKVVRTEENGSESILLECVTRWKRRELLVDHELN